MPKWKEAVVGMSVILTDSATAILFTAWTDKDIEAEIEEHFPGGDPEILLCPRMVSDFNLSEWPRHPGPLAIRKHVVPRKQVCHILPMLEELQSGT